MKNVFPKMIILLWIISLNQIKAFAGTSWEAGWYCCNDECKKKCFRVKSGSVEKAFIPITSGKIVNNTLLLQIDATSLSKKEMVELLKNGITVKEDVTIPIEEMERLKITNSNKEKLKGTKAIKLVGGTMTTRRVSGGCCTIEVKLVIKF